MNFLDCVLDFIFPPVCGICLKTSKNYICEDCIELIKFKSLNKIDRYNDRYFKEHLYILKYEGIIRQRLLDYKFKEKSYLHRSFSEMILNSKKNIEFIKKYDVLIPVPIHKDRMKIRGYNQSELIAKDLVHEIKNIKLENNVIIKNKNIVAQSLLNKKQRENNIKHVYQIKSAEKIINKKVLLLDDIYTTGSTLNECSKVLKEAGCKEVGVITIAKD